MANEGVSGGGWGRGEWGVRGNRQRKGRGEEGERERRKIGG